MQRLAPIFRLVLCMALLTAVNESALAQSSNYMGINIGAAQDYAGFQMYADVIKVSRSFSSPVDASGWPTQDFNFYVWHNVPNMHGTYTLYFSGKALVTSNIGPINLTYDEVTNTSKGSFFYSYAGNGYLQLTFTRTQRNNWSALGTGVAGIKLMRPMSPGSTQSYGTGTLFHQAGKNLVSLFSVIRFMDYLGINSSAQKTWGDRPLPRWPSYNRNPGNAYGWVGIGGPWEHVIKYCNENNKDCWINIPAKADDYYVRQVALMFKYGSDGLNPYTSAQSAPVWQPLWGNLKLYVEYSNELWNTKGAFRQSSDNCQLASDELVRTSGWSPLNFDRTWNGAVFGSASFQWNFCFRRVAQRGAQISKIFREVFGDSAMMSRVRPVLMSQLGYYLGPFNQAMIMMMGYYDNLGGNFNATPRPPSYYFYGAGGSGYYSPSSDVSSLDQIFADPGFSPTGPFGVAVRKDAGIAAAMGLKRIAYEGGPGLDTTGGVHDAVSAAAVKDSRMTTVMINQHNSWSQNGGDLLVYYQAAGDFQWGFTDNIYDLWTPKLNAIRSLAGTARAATTYGTLIPGTVPGNVQDICYFHWKCGNSDFNVLGELKWASYTFRAGNATYHPVVLEVSVANNATIGVYTDGVLIGTKTVTAPGSYTFWSSTLNTGLHGVLVRAISGSFTLKSVSVK